MKSFLVISFLIFSVVFAGCTSSYRVEVVDGLTYLEISKGDDVKEGDVFLLVKTSRSSPSRRPGATRYVRTTVARVRVIRVPDERHALVELLDGQIEPGLRARKVDPSQ